ncbi:amino acid or gaba permease [Tricladium varicosporioides]|nr:amino acid or gaba permease [Hymenoscyphus varicosporioides]
MGKTSADEKIEPLPRMADSSSMGEGTSKNILSKDEYQLAQLGYKQEFFRSLGLFENWAATFTSMNFASGIPVLFGWVMYTGGPTAAFTNWTMVGGLSFIVSLSMAEIAAALPTAGGIYYWAYKLGGSEWGPFLAWMTGWWNWAGWVTVVPGVQQGSTNFLISALEIQYPDAEVLSKGWFAWLLTSIGMFFAVVPNVINQKVLQWYFRFAIVIFHILVILYWIWFPIKASQTGGFQSGSGVFDHFYNGINSEGSTEGTDPYCWIISILFGAWVFYGYDASVHLAEETQEASEVVAKGMWMSTLSAWIMSVPTLIIILFCMQDFDGIISGTYANNWAEYLIQLVGPTSATAILALLWVDSTCATASCFMSAQRVTYAISRDGILPGSTYFRKLSKKNHMPINAAVLVLAMSIIITTAVIGSTVAFSAITATATIATNVSYLFPIIARQTVGRNTFEPARWNLGRWTVPCALVSSLYISFLVVVLLLPQVFPVTGKTLNYAPIMIGGISFVSLLGWVLPLGFGGRGWFKGPQRTISEEEIISARVEGEEEVVSETVGGKF